MTARALLERLRAGEVLSAEDARWAGLSMGGADWSEAQLGAFAMASCQRQMSAEARIALTEGMRDSGDVLQWDLPGPVVDKHSTGGVGDPVSLILAPALAACGVFVPMISGRGLGHTGGTLDKLDAIPGYATEIGRSRLTQVVSEVGAAIVGATAQIAPSDKRLYAVRDVTGTVRSLDLITASILSKKLAAGLDALVLDVKTGSGAFMSTRDEAEELAQALSQVANGAGCKTAVLITDMSQPLADAAGNAVELRAVMDVLTAAPGNARLRAVSVALGAALLQQAGVANGAAAAKQIDRALASGAAAERFGRMVAALGGPVDFAETWARALPEATVQQEVAAPQTGHVTQIDTRALGEAVVMLGGGRRHAGDPIDPAVGLSQIAPLGCALTRGDPLAMIHAADEARAAEAAARVAAAYKIAAHQVTPPAPVLMELG